MEVKVLALLVAALFSPIIRSLPSGAPSNATLQAISISLSLIPLLPKQSFLSLQFQFQFPLSISLVNPQTLHHLQLINPINYTFHSSIHYLQNCLSPNEYYILTNLLFFFS